MSRRNDITQEIVTELKRIDGGVDTRPIEGAYTYNTNVFNNVFDKFLFMNEINDFPTITISKGDGEDRFYYGAGTKEGEIDMLIRGYVKGSESQDHADDLAEDIEHAVDMLNQTINSGTCDIIDALVTTVNTDEGLFEPFGLCDVRVYIRYEVKEYV